MAGEARAAAAMAAWPDRRLVEACLQGNEDAWRILIDKYKNLIYSIPIKCGMSQSDASEVFQQVCLMLVEELPRLRDPQSLAAWLITVTSHKASHWARREQRYQPMEKGEPEVLASAPEKLADAVLLEIEQEQMLREALSEIDPRCRELIHMLFFETPARPYAEVAKDLQLAKGSIGFIRMRCLGRLRSLLEDRSFR